MTSTIEKIEKLNALLLGLGAVLGWSFSLLHVPSFLIGGAVMQANFWLLKKIVGILLRQFSGTDRGKGLGVLWIFAKGALFLLLLSALFIRYPIHPVSFTVGVSLLLVTCMIVTLSGSPKNSHEHIPNEQTL